MAALEHKHIAAVHEIGEFRGVLYLVMPHLHGESLKDQLRRELEVLLKDNAS